MLSSLLSERKLPLNGWDDLMIEYALNELAMMDSNNYPKNVGVGEREGRVYSSLVAKRHYNLSHGIGRSGDIAEVQPKAAGSSLIAKLTNILATYAITRICGFSSLKHGQVLPMATGMSLALSMMALKSACKNEKPNAKYVIWPRIDQKSCFKCIFVAGLIPIVIENRLVPSSGGSRVGCQIETDTAAVEEAIATHGAENILCVLSTTRYVHLPLVYCIVLHCIVLRRHMNVDLLMLWFKSKHCCTCSCFAPRRPDKIDEIAKLCAHHGVGHVVNNAYGLQCTSIAKLVNRACTVGRVDYVVQSTDKNFLVPVGGAIVSSPSPACIDSLTKCYAGRASLDPILDLFITLLSMGERGLKGLLTERERLFAHLNTSLEALCVWNRDSDAGGLALVHSPENPISVAISIQYLAEMQSQLQLEQAAVTCRVSQETVTEPELGSFPSVSVGDVRPPASEGADAGAGTSTGAAPTAFDVNSIGAMLFYNCVSGTRVIYRQAKPTVINGFSFTNWGSHANAFPSMPYITAAVAVGMTEEDVTKFISEFTKVLKKCVKKIGAK